MTPLETCICARNNSTSLLEHDSYLEIELSNWSNHLEEVRQLCVFVGVVTQQSRQRCSHLVNAHLTVEHHVERKRGAE